MMAKAVRKQSLAKLSFSPKGTQQSEYVRHAEFSIPVVPPRRLGGGHFGPVPFEVAYEGTDEADGRPDWVARGSAAPHETVVVLKTPWIAVKLGSN